MNKRCVAIPNDGRTFTVTNNKGKVVASCNRVVIDFTDGFFDGKMLMEPETMAFPCDEAGNVWFGNEFGRWLGPECFETVASELDVTIDSESWEIFD